MQFPAFPGLLAVPFTKDPTQVCANLSSYEFFYISLSYKLNLPRPVALSSIIAPKLHENLWDSWFMQPIVAYDSTCLADANAPRGHPSEVRPSRASLNLGGC